MTTNTPHEKLEPAFDFSSPKGVLLAQGEIEININGTKYTCGGEARLDLVPSPSIRFFASFDSGESPDSLSFAGEPDSLHFNGTKINGFPLSYGGFSMTDGVFKSHPIKWSPSEEPVFAAGDDTTLMNRVVFHLFNFPEFIGTRGSTEIDGSATCSIWHIDLEYDGWEIELKSLTSTSQNTKKIKSEGGYYLTHVGCVRKKDASEFTGKEANEILGAIRYFLSFSIGCWCNPVCNVGFDKNEARVWESWTSPKGGRKTATSWFDHHHGEQLAELFPLFMKKWTDNTWHDTLGEIIYLYLSANDSSRGIDIGIIVAQAALERFSFEYSVNDRQLISSEGFKKLWASDQYRLLFSSLHLPLVIPNETDRLLAQSKQNNCKWLDSPMALTEIRNSLVHPDPTKRGKAKNDAIYDAWKLSLWYIELGILAICGYNGSYGNRLQQQRWVGQVDQVPWQSNRETV